jgi:DNA primase
MPLTWDEVNDDLDPRNYTIKNALDRMEKMGEDPVLPVLTEKPKLAKSLARLDALVKG